MDLQHSLFAPHLPAEDDAEDASATAAPLGDDALVLHAELVAQARQKLRLGHALTREDHKAIREAAILRLRDTHWPDRAAIADALGVTPKVVERYKAEGAPIESHAPTAKEPLYLWLIAALRTKGGQAAADTSAKDQQAAEEARWRRLKNDRLEGSLVAEAESAAMAGLVQVVRSTKAELLHAVPTRVAAAIDGLSRAAVERLIRDTIRQSLTELARKAGALQELDAAAQPPSPTPAADCAPRAVPPETP